MNGNEYFEMTWKDHCLRMGEKTLVMGILNITPDSFSDGGRFLDHGPAIKHAEKMVADGAHIIDIGGESTKPFSEPVSEEEEINRVIPVIRELSGRIPIPISIDTSKAGVAREALDSGAAIINDISALRADKNMAAVAAEYDVPIILMHMKGTPKDMQVAPSYDDLLAEIVGFLENRIKDAVSHGIKRERVIIDPGIGFGKTFENNFTILKHMERFKALNSPILVGSSRKAFIRNSLKTGIENNVSPDDPVVETGTQATISTAVLNGAHIVRCHDVYSARATLKIIDAIRNAE